MKIRLYNLNWTRSTAIKNNLSGYDWSVGFLYRHPGISQRVAENMKRVRANINPEIIQKFFNNLESVIREVPSENIMNYEESAFQNDSGKEHVLVR